MYHSIYLVLFFKMDTYVYCIFHFCVLGRQFYRCPEVSDGVKCDFFLWKDDEQSVSSPSNHQIQSQSFSRQPSIAGSVINFYFLWLITWLSWRSCTNETFIMPQTYYVVEKLNSINLPQNIHNLILFKILSQIKQGRIYDFNENLIYKF